MAHLLRDRAAELGDLQRPAEDTVMRQQGAERPEGEGLAGAPFQPAGELQGALAIGTGAWERADILDDRVEEGGPGSGGHRHHQT